MYCNKWIPKLIPLRLSLNRFVRCTTSDPREEPGALAAHARICGGRGEIQKASSLPRPPDKPSTAVSIGRSRIWLLGSPHRLADDTLRRVPPSRDDERSP